VKVLESKGLGEYLELREAKKQDDGENDTTRSFIIYAIHQIFMRI
jgi:hypothetical protein